MTAGREKKIILYLLNLADEYGVPWLDYFTDEYHQYSREIEPLGYWDTIMFLADKQLAARGK